MIMKEKLFDVTFLGKDKRGDILKGIKIMAKSSNEALKLAKELANSREIYSAIEDESK